MKFQKRKSFPVIFFTSLICLFMVMDCRKKQDTGETPSFVVQDSEKQNLIILKIQDSFYFNSDFEKHVRRIVGEDVGSLTLDSLSRLADNFIEEKLFLEAAHNQQISISLEEQKEYLTKLLNSSWPKGKNIWEDEIEVQSLIEGLLIEKYIYNLVKDIEIKKEEIQEYYDINKRDFLKPVRVKVSQILVKTEEEAIEVLKKLKNTQEETFKELARTKSIGAESSKGGEVGVFEMGQLPFEIEKVVFSLKEGEISPVVESSYGYHIFRLDKRYEPELVSEEDATAEIQVKLLDQKIKNFVSKHLSELKNQMEWSFYPENLSFPYQRNTND